MSIYIYIYIPPNPPRFDHPLIRIRELPLYSYQDRQSKRALLSAVKHLHNIIMPITQGQLPREGIVNLLLVLMVGAMIKQIRNDVAVALGGGGEEQGLDDLAAF